MTQRDKEFLEAMWKKAEEKEQNMRLAEELTKTPLNKGVNSFLWDLFQGIGLGQLYAGMGDILSVSFCIAAAFMYIGLRIVGAGLASACSIVFTAAPVLYASVFYLSLVKERQNQTYEQLMSYKYTFLHLMTARMFSNSLIGIGLNLIYAAVLSVRYSADFLRLAATAFASLMIFSLLLAMGIERGKKTGWGAAAGAGWILANLVFFQMSAAWYERLMEGIPVLLFAVVGAVAAVVHVRQLLVMTGQPFRKEYADAAS